MIRNGRKIIALSTVALSCCCLVSGCGRIPKLENGQDAVVTIKNGDISVDTLYESVKDRYALTTLLDLIDKQILEKEYKSDDEEKQEVEAQIDSWLSTFGSEDILLQQMSSYYGVRTMDELREVLALEHKRNKVTEDYARKTVSDKEIQKFYDEEIFGDIEVSKILIEPKVEEGMTSSDKTAAEEEAKKIANEVVSKLKAGEKWEDLVKQYTNDEAHKEDKGNIGYVAHGDLESDAEEAILKIKKGEFTSPIKTAYGYEIYLRGEQKDKAKLETLKEDIVEELAEEKTKNDSTLAITSMVEKRKEYKVKITDKELKAQYENYIDNAIERAKKSDASKNS